MPVDCGNVVLRIVSPLPLGDCSRPPMPAAARCLVHAGCTGTSACKLPAHATTGPPRQLANGVHGRVRERLRPPLRYFLPYGVDAECQGSSVRLPPGALVPRAVLTGPFGAMLDACVRARTHEGRAVQGGTDM